MLIPYRVKNQAGKPAVSPPCQCTVDGVLNEADQQSAEPLTGLIQFEPNEGAPESQRTEVRILYDEAAIYVAVVLYDEHSDRIETSLGRRSYDALNPLVPWTFASYDKPIDDQIGDTFDVPPDNTLLIKLNHVFLR